MFYKHDSAVIDSDCQIGDNTKIWHFSHLMSGCIVGDNCVIGQNVYIASSVRLGNNVKVQNNVSLYDGVVCEDDVFLGPSCVFTNVVNPRSEINQKDKFKSTTICKGATIGANATIVCGHTIGKYAFVGAGAVVTKDIPDFALWVGNPAVHCGWVSEAGIKLEFDADGVAICSSTQDKYLLLNNCVTKFI
jgi:UDP-2-acetamido-3-amino-2,3-dideoxy-glucuronate N-acetyltransferase